MATEVRGQDSPDPTLPWVSSRHSIIQRLRSVRRRPAPVGEVA
jgi:hypothetical protein